MRKPYRVMVWGPGGLGAVSIWEILQSAAYELVGVRCYGEAKNGVDVGTLIGIDAVGIKATTDVEALLAIDCDCIVYTARDMGNFNTDDEILMLLSRGKNVVTPLPYQNAHLFRDKAFSDKLHAACKAGGSVFHASGIDPDLISDRVLIALTGMCTEVKSLKLQENWECSGTEPELLAVAGFGQSLEDAARIPVAAAVSTNFLKAIAYTVERLLGVHYERVEETHENIPAPHELVCQHMTVRPGTVGRVTHRFRAWVANQEEPFFTMEYNWVIGYEMLPEGVRPDQAWVAEIEGRPSLKMSIDMTTSLKTRERYYQVGRLRTEPGYHGTMAPCLQAIPHICTAQPGVLPSFGPGLHWMKDPRDSVTLKH